ncbi:MAG: cation:proton antiporter [Eubacteriales bacterium]
MKQFLMLGNETSQVILSLSLMLFAGFLVTRVTKRLKLPNVTGYIFAGILLGPYLLDAVPVEVASGMGFVTDIALAYIAFGVGRYFKIATLKKSGGGTLIITVLEALLAMAAITLPMIFLFHLPVPFSLLLGAIGCATAPASTIMTIRQYHAKGPFVNLILQVVALDDAVALVAFSVCTAVTQALEGGGKVNAMDVAAPVLWNLGAVVLGIGLGWVLHRLISERRSSDHRLVIANGVILGMTGLCTLLNISPLLSCMALGASYINLSGNKHLFKEINRFTPPVLLLFFVLSGMRLNIPRSGHGRRNWRRLLFPAYCGKIRWRLCRLRSLPHAGAYQKLAGAGVDPPGRRIHRTGCFGGADASAGDRRAAVRHFPLFSSALRNRGTGLRQSLPVPVPYARAGR